MRGLRKYLTPFAPDQSGAVSVLYELGGILVICDAGGCVGNICGFDEPRWQEKKSAIFSAGLRDMDAIMGRDELLVKKLILAAEEIDAKFVALIGTPIPSVIGTDYHALTMMAERKLSLPVLAVNTNGMDLSDEGCSKAYVELLRRFAGDETYALAFKDKKEEGKRLGILGCSPIEMSRLDAAKDYKSYYKEAGYEQVFVFGMDGGLEEFALAPTVEKNIVVSPSGIAAAKYMEKRYQIPYEVEDVLGRSFLLDEIDKNNMDAQKAKRVLLMDQQISANSMREILVEKGWKREDITVASWFMLDKTYKEEGDIHLLEEDQFTELVREGNFDLIVGDPVCKQMCKNFKGLYLDRFQFALSGNLND